MGRPKEFDPGSAVDAAMEVFWANGYAATTPADLVAELGIGRGSLYNTFHSKGELYRTALVRYRDATTARLVEILEGPGTATERLENAVTAIVEHAATEDDRRGCLVTNAIVETAPHDPEVATLVTRVVEHQVELFRTVIQQARIDGTVSSDVDPTAAARYLVTFLNGIRVLQRAGTGSRELRALAPVALRAVLSSPAPTA